jgi:predicted nucleic acid-binding protein
VRIVIDTNVIVSGLYDPDSPPGRVLQAGALGRLQLCAPEFVRGELERVLVDVLEFPSAEVGMVMARLPIEWLEEAIYRDSLAEARRVLRDPSDAPVLACGFALGVDVVSGDKDLHAANQKRIKVWKPADL